MNAASVCLALLFCMQFTSSFACVCLVHCLCARRQHPTFSASSGSSQRAAPENKDSREPSKLLLGPRSSKALQYPLQGQQSELCVSSAQVWEQISCSHPDPCVGDSVSLSGP